MVVSVPASPASVRKKSVPLWIQPGTACMRMRWPFSGARSRTMFVSGSW